jgi:hypothetical protein
MARIRMIGIRTSAKTKIRTRAKTKIKTKPRTKIRTKARTNNHDTTMADRYL